MSATKVPSALTQLERVITDLSGFAFRVHEEGDVVLGNILHGHVRALSDVHQDLQDNYVRLDTKGEVPTVAQGVALARFLRPHFNSDKSHWGAFVSRSGAGLGSNYLHVRFNDGYEGGIDKDGRTST